MSAGTYYLVGGGLSVLENATLNGNGVTIVNTYPPTKAGAFGPFDFMPGSNVNLTASTSGNLAGIVLFEDRTAPAGTNELSFGDGSAITGTVYLPANQVVFSAKSTSPNTTITGGLIAPIITVKKQVQLTITGTVAGGSSGINKVSMIE
jgi:hypothetical protein